MTTNRKYLGVRERVPSDVKDNSILDISGVNVTPATHGFHKYPAKFIPHIPRWAIEKYLIGQRPRLVFDPFCGSGTTLVESFLAGHHSIGMDVDPLSCLIAKVKTTPINTSLLKEIIKWLTLGLRRRKKGQFVPDCGNIAHWFTPDAVAKLSLIRSLLDEIPGQFGNSQVKDIQDLLYVCFSSIIRRVSNADNESQKTYVSHTNVKRPDETIGLFLSQLDFFEDRITAFSNSVDRRLTSHIVCTSSVTNLRSKLGKLKPALIITSPPYIKAIDYIYNQMAELFWIGDLFGMQTQDLQNARKDTYIGTKHIPKRAYEEYSPFAVLIGIRSLDRKIQQVYTLDKKNGHKHSYVVYRYFAEMEQHFAEIAKCLDQHAHYILVVGDSSVSNIFFETSDFLTHIAARYGFDLKGKWGYKIKNRFMRFDRKGRGGTIEVDWVLDLERK